MNSKSLDQLPGAELIPVYMTFPEICGAMIALKISVDQNQKIATEPGNSICRSLALSLFKTVSKTAYEFPEFVLEIFDEIMSTDPKWIEIGKRIKSQTEEPDA